jgi:hypothetical protein
MKLMPIDSMIVAFGQILQPATAKSIYAFAQGTQLTETLNEKEFEKRFNALNRMGFFWRTSKKEYVVTPKGYDIACDSIDYKKRDKFRLLVLNERRYQK